MIATARVSRALRDRWPGTSITVSRTAAGYTVRMPERPARELRTWPGPGQDHGHAETSLSRWLGGASVTVLAVRQLRPHPTRTGRAEITLRIEEQLLTGPPVIEDMPGAGPESYDRGGAYDALSGTVSDADEGP